MESAIEERTQQKRHMELKTLQQPDRNNVKPKQEEEINSSRAYKGNEEGGSKTTLSFIIEMADFVSYANFSRDQGLIINAGEYIRVH